MNTDVTYSCQCCKCKVTTGGACASGYRAPGKIQMGRSMMDVMVCECCQKMIAAAIDDLFQGKHPADPSKCGLCKCDLATSGGPYYASRKPMDAEQWKIVPVCKTCFDVKYSGCCKTAATGG